MSVRILKSIRWTAPLGVLLLFVVGVAPLYAKIRTAATAQLYVNPASQEVLVGFPGSFEVRLNNVTNLFAVELNLTYDPFLIEVLDANSGQAGVQVSDGTMFAGLTGDPLLYQNQVVPATGTIVYRYRLDNSYANGVTGSGSLIRVDFMARHPGISPVNFTLAILSEKDGWSISRTVTNGRVAVVLVPPTPTSASPVATIPITPTITATPTAPTPRPTVVVYTDPVIRDVEPGQESWVDIRIAFGAGLYGAWVRMSYDPQIVTILDADGGTPGTQLEHGDLFAGKDWFCLGNEVPVSGTIVYGAKLRYDEESGPTGTRLARILIRGGQLGSSPLHFEEAILADREGLSFATVAQDGVVNVLSYVPEGTPTPTFTPATPTVTPTASPTPTPRPLIYVWPDAVTLAVGGEADIEVRVANVIDLNGVEFHIDFDSGVIRVLDADILVTGTQIILGGFLLPDAVAQNIVEDVAGRIHGAYAQSAPNPPRSGGGLVARFRIRALAQGATALRMHDTALTDVLGQPMAHTAAGGFVAVNTRVVTGRVLLAGRTRHSGSRLMRGATPLGTTGEDGGFVFASPVGVGSSLTILAEHDKYLPAVRTFVVPAAQIVDLGTVTLVAGDVIGPPVSVARGVGCPGSSPVTTAGPQDLRINVLDLGFVAARFGKRSTATDWGYPPNPCSPEYTAHRADVNGDDVINIYDLVLLGSRFGVSGSQPW